MDTNYINIIKGAFIKNIVKIIVVGIVCSIALVCENLLLLILWLKAVI